MKISSETYVVQAVKVIKRLAGAVPTALCLNTFNAGVVLFEETGTLGSAFLLQGRLRVDHLRHYTNSIQKLFRHNNKQQQKLASLWFISRPYVLFVFFFCMMRHSLSAIKQPKHSRLFCLFQTHSTFYQVESSTHLDFSTA